jgi:hypothetical protein
MTQAQKVLARYQVLLDRTAKAQGDLGRTIDSPSNQMRILQQRVENLSIKIGTALLPSVNRAVKGLSTGVDGLTNAWDAMGEAGQDAIVNTAMLLAAGGPLLWGISKAIAAVKSLRVALMRLPAAARIGAVGAGAALAASIVLPPVWEALNKRAATMSYKDYLLMLQMQPEWQEPMSRAEFEAQQRGIRDAWGWDERGRPKLEMPEYEALSDFEEEWRKASEAGRQGAADLDQALKSAGLSTKDYVDALVESEPAAIAAAQATEAMRLRLVGLEDAQEGATYAMRDAQEAFRLAQERVEALSDKLALAKQRLEDLSRPRLVGMQEFEDRLFAIDQALKRLELDKLQLGPVSGENDPRYGRMQAIESAIENLRRQERMLHLEQSLKFDPALRRIEQEAKGIPAEMTEAAAIKNIQATKKEIGALEKQLAAAKEATAAQEKRIKDLEKANEGLSRAIKETQRDLELQEERQRLVNDALAKAYQWLMLDREKFEELGLSGTQAVQDMDTATRGILSTVRLHAESDSKAAIEAIEKVIKKAKEAERELAKMVFAPPPGPTNAVPLPGGVRAYAEGGVLTEPVVGRGLRSGDVYTLREQGEDEYVVPASKARAFFGTGGGATVIYLTIDGDLVSMSNIMVGGREEAVALGQDVGQEVLRALAAGVQIARGQGSHVPQGLVARN